MRQNKIKDPEPGHLIEYLREEASPEIRAEIEKWLEVENNKKTLQRVARIHYLQLRYLRIKKRDTEYAFKKVLRRIAWKKRRKTIGRWAGAAAILLLVAANAALLISRSGVNRDPEFILLGSNNEKKVEYTLPDGTVVYLNRNSTLRFPVKFSPDNRSVTLQGEAFFEVKYDPQSPFRVETVQGPSVEVLGTKFNLEAFAGDSIMQATLMEGSIRFLSDGDPGNSVMLVPGEILRYNSSTSHYGLNTTDYTVNASWMDDVFIFRDTRLTEVVRQLGHNFNVDFVIKDKNIEDYVFTGTFDNRDLPLILDYMKFSSDIKIEFTTSPNKKTTIILDKN